MVLHKLTLSLHQQKNKTYMKELDTTALSDLFATRENAVANMLGNLNDLVGSLGLELVGVSFNE